MSAELNRLNLMFWDSIDSCKVLECDLRSNQKLADEFDDMAHRFRKLNIHFNQFTETSDIAELCNKLAMRTRLVSLALMRNNKQFKLEAFAELKQILNDAYSFKEVAISRHNILLTTEESA